MLLAAQAIDVSLWSIIAEQGAFFLLAAGCVWLLVRSTKEHSEERTKLNKQIQELKIELVEIKSSRDVAIRQAQLDERQERLSAGKTHREELAAQTKGVMAIMQKQTEVNQEMKDAVLSSRKIIESLYEGQQKSQEAKLSDIERWIKERANE